MKSTQGPEQEDGAMKAMVRDRFGSADVLRLDDIETPRISSDEALVRVRASSVSIGDWFWLTGSPLLMRPASGLLRPRDRVLGRDVAGIVEAVGADVSDLRVGDEVYGEIPFGAHAEYAAVPARLLARKPANLTFEQAAAVPLAGGTALQGLRDAGRLEAGQHVLVNGASGARRHLRGPDRQGVRGRGQRRLQRQQRRARARHRRRPRHRLRLRGLHPRRCPL